MRMRTSIFVCAQLLAGGLAILPATTVRPEPLDERHLWVTVLDKEGMPVADLTAEEFQIEENGKKQAVKSAQGRRTEPLLLGLLIDMSGSRVDQFHGAEAKPASEMFAQVLVRGDMGFVIGFSDRMITFGEATSEIALLQEAVNRAASTGPYGASGLFSAVKWTCERSIQDSARNRILVTTTDGAVNQGSVNLKGAIEAAQRAVVSVYVLLLDDPGLATRLRVRAKGEMNKLARETGGRRFEIRKADDMADAFAQVARDLDGRYLLSYMPANPIPGNKAAKIKVKTTRKDTEVFHSSRLYRN